VSIVQPADIEVNLYSADGKLVRNLYSGRIGIGGHNIEWDGLDASGAETKPGVFFCVVDTGGERLVKKLVVVR
jgi:flagellar hook assembly protein FlgD